MNREIKFRAWEKHYQRMSKVTLIEWKPSYLYHRICTQAIVNGKKIDEQYAYDFGGDNNGLVLMQYTGECAPSCGEMIYDGDILEQSYISPLSGERIVKRYLIQFEDGCFKAKCIGHSPYGDTYLHFVIENGGVFEVKNIGDKFQNPELLEVENE